MRHETRAELYSLARCVGAEPSDLLSLARLAAGDERLLSVDDLTQSGAEEVMANLRLYGATERDWLAVLAETI